MLLSNLLIPVVGMVAVGVEAMPYLPRPKFSDFLASHLPSTSSPPVHQCLFAPNQPSQSAQRSDSIPSHAWSYISSLLASHSQAPFTPTGIQRNLVQTLRLSEQTQDSTLEGVVLGLVFTAPEPLAGEKELRSLGEPSKANEDRECLAEAIKQVEVGKQMEGVIEFAGKGRVGFLVYRVD